MDLPELGWLTWRQAIVLGLALLAAAVVLDHHHGGGPGPGQGAASTVAGIARPVAAEGAGIGDAGEVAVFLSRMLDVHEQHLAVG